MRRVGIATDPAGASGTRQRAAAGIGTLVGIALGVFVATVVADAVLVFIPLIPGRVLAAVPWAALALALVGATAALARAGGRGWAAALAGSMLAHLLLLAFAVSMASVMQGNAAVMSPAGYGAFVFVLLVGAIAALGAGYWGAMAVLSRGTPRSGRREHRFLAAGPVATGLALVAASGLGAWAAGSALVLDETTTTVHRVTITESAIAIDAPTIQAGPVTWLASVSGQPPYDLTLIDVTRQSVVQILTPPSGSVDFLLLRTTMAPGEWYFTAGVEQGDGAGTEPGSAAVTEDGLPVGPLVARFRVTP